LSGYALTSGANSILYLLSLLICDPLNAARKTLWPFHKTHTALHPMRYLRRRVYDKSGPPTAEKKGYRCTPQSKARAMRPSRLLDAHPPHMTGTDKAKQDLSLQVGDQSDPKGDLRT